MGPHLAAATGLQPDRRGSATGRAHSVAMTITAPEALAGERLRMLQLFAGCSDAELEHVASVVLEEDVAPDRTLMAEGESADRLLIVADGLARVTQRGSDVAFLGPGSFVGEMGLLNGAPRNATVTSVTPMKLYVVARDGFEALLEGSPAIRAAVEAAAAARRGQLPQPEPRLRLAPPTARVARPVTRRRRRVVATGALLAVAIAAAGGYVATRRNVSRPVSLASSLSALHRQPVAAMVSPGAQPVAAPAPIAHADAPNRAAVGTPRGALVPPPLRVPATGVYTYQTAGRDWISMFGAHHDYPSETHATVRPTGNACGWQVDWPVVAEHVNHRTRCSEPGRLLGLAEGSEVEFFSQRDGENFVCEPPALVLATADAVGSRHEATCRAESGDGTITTRTTNLGRESLMVGGVAVSAFHVLGDTTMSGKATGTARDELWLDPDTGLVLKELRTVDTDAHAVFGHVRYQERASFLLSSLTPQT